MALGDSIVSVCNIAMTAIGEDLIVSVFPPDNTKRAILAAQRYDDTRRAVLAAYPWRCNKKLAQLAAAAQAPLFRYGAAYPLPADCLGIDEVAGIGRERWEVIGNQLMTNAVGSAGAIDVVYGYDLQDPSLFEPLLTHVIGYALGGELTEPLTQSRVTRQTLMQLAEAKAGMARFVSSRSASSQRFEDDVLLRARR